MANEFSTKSTPRHRLLLSEAGSIDLILQGGSGPKSLSEGSLGIGQKEIADAVWASVSAGDPIALAAIARQIEKLSPPLQAYLLACSLEVKRFYQDLTTWKRDFDRVQKEGDAQRKQGSKEGKAVAGSIAGGGHGGRHGGGGGQCGSRGGTGRLGGPGVGAGGCHRDPRSQSAARAQSEDQVRPGYEGVSVFRGFAAEAPESLYEDRYLTLKQAVVQDEVAFSLPAVSKKTPFDFAPRLAAFQEAAHQMGLYPEDGTKT